VRDAGLVRMTARELKQYAVEAYTQKKTITEIGAEIGVTTARASQLISQAQDEFLIDASVKQRYLMMQLATLEVLKRKLFKILDTDHLMVSQGHVVSRRVGTDEDDEPVWEELVDDMPKMSAVDRLLRVLEREAKLLGLDAAEKLDVSSSVVYSIEGVDMNSLR
jgi:hypothetical protein